MPRWEPLHPDFVVAMRVLDAFGLPYAELWRMLRPIAARLETERPSYWRVRRFAIAERRLKAAPSDQLDDVLRDLFAGLIPGAR